MGNIPSVAPGQLATADQYNALQSGLNPLVESSYTSWKLKSGFPITTPVALTYHVPFVDEIDDILYLDSGIGANNLLVINLANASVISSITTDLESSANSNGNPSPSQMRPGTAMNLYYLYYISSSFTVNVLYKGSQLYSFTLPSPPFATVGTGYPIGPNISPTGKYIVVFPYGDSSLYVYEGQP